MTPDGFDQIQKELFTAGLHTGGWDSGSSVRGQRGLLTGRLGGAFLLILRVLTKVCLGSPVGLSGVNAAVSMQGQSRVSNALELVHLDLMRFRSRSNVVCLLD